MHYFYGKINWGHGGMWFIHCMEAVRISENPSQEVPLYVYTYFVTLQFRIVFMLTGNKIRFAQLKLLKWNDEKGEVQRFFLMEKISHKWRDIGELLDISPSKLESISKSHHDDADECCQAVLVQWFDNPPPDYSTTWQGVIDLLEDNRLGQVVSELKTVLSKVYQ